MKERIAFVCQRYGLEVNGGSELYCRQLAEKFKEEYDVEVYTTCAMDYTTWANSYEPGTETLNGVTVHRFKNKSVRELNAFAAICQKVYANELHGDEDEETWIDEQGPVCPELLKELAEKHKQYKAVIFMTYLYWLSAKGLPMGFDNAFLIPTAHDEEPIYLRHYDQVFSGAKGFVWLTPEEKRFSEKRFPQIKGVPGVMTGAGVDIPTGELPEIPEKIKEEQYIVYTGRIDEFKGCSDMFRFFLEYKRQFGGTLKLVLMGKEVLKVPDSPDIISLGFVSEEMKFAVMREAKALVLFSRFESLSMVVLESMMMRRPVLVNGHCEVLKGHCMRSNAGLYFKNYPEFAETLNYLLEHDEEYEIMRENGKRYVEENYQWDVIVERIKGLITSVCPS